MALRVHNALYQCVVNYINLWHGYRVIQLQGSIGKFSMVIASGLQPRVKLIKSKRLFSTSGVKNENEDDHMASYTTSEKTLGPAIVVSSFVREPVFDIS